MESTVNGRLCCAAMAAMGAQRVRLSERVRASPDFEMVWVRA